MQTAESDGTPLRGRPSGRNASSCALAALVAAGCSITPSLPPTTARGVGAGETHVGAWALPSLGGTVTRGLTDRLDVAASAELVGIVSLGAKYTVLDRPDFAIALEGRGFFGFDDSVAKARGIGAGPVFEIGSDPVRLVAGARYDELEHETYDDESYLDWGDLKPGRGQDYGSIVQAYAVVAFDFTSRGHLLLGASCDFYVALDRSPDIYGDRPDGHACYPMAGIDLSLGRANGR